MSGMLRSAAIRTKLQEMTESIGMVREHLPDSADAFTRLGIVRDGIYKRVEYAVENVFDICAMLNTDLRLGVPGTDEDIVDHLIQHGVLSRAMLTSLKAMKGFRNIVVHRYGAIDDALTFAILQEHIGDFTQFRQEVEAFLSSRDAAADDQP
ncbi:MAG: DUF86 domain-containing protein [Methanofollis sp.]|uniref:type VII toxin-antitoxin system HepT family RNase toxin n=1 Tax=Methanofollis sp. TaxID=2052835 RepID=UPI0026340C94|nr:DUF86 domain-containing protein [Methanofollis sp.]MDD4256129.1 DUF86 domain-containing protein [Methanofollis sp.]